MGLKFRKQGPFRASPTISQVAKRGSANLALHNLLSIPHRKLERHQVGIIPNGLSCRQRHEPGPLSDEQAGRATWPGLAIGWQSQTTTWAGVGPEFPQRPLRT